MADAALEGFTMRKAPITLTWIAALTVANGASANLITNGDFESGNTGFSSDYAFASIQSGATVYNIVSDPANDHNQATSYGDHTTGSGLMMAVNGCCEPAPSGAIPVVWSQSVSVNPFTNYVFSMFFSSWYPSNPATIQFSTTELGVLGSVTAPSTAGIWQQFTLSFNSGANSLLTLNLTDTLVLTGGAGNDFALDDLSLVQVPEPGTLSLLGAGLLGLSLTRRRKRSP